MINLVMGRAQGWPKDLSWADFGLIKKYIGSNLIGSCERNRKGSLGSGFLFFSYGLELRGNFIGP
jgi:hypothetical protein